MIVFMDSSSEVSGKSSELSGRGILMDANLSGKVVVDTCSFIAHISTQCGISSLG